MEIEPLEFGGFYHFYNKGNNNENIFMEDKNYAFFLNKVAKYLIPIADIYAYCLLKNHFHILLKIKDKEEFVSGSTSKIHLPFSNLFNSYAKSINNYYNRSGSLFQEHLKRNKVENEEYLKQLILYIHLNPVKHGFVDDFRKYKHSSYAAFLSDKPTNLKREYILDLFGGRDNFEFCHHEKQIRYEGLIGEIDEMDS